LEPRGALRGPLAAVGAELTAIGWGANARTSRLRGSSTRLCRLWSTVTSPPMGCAPDSPTATESSAGGSEGTPAGGIRLWTWPRT